jgi:hypothetical protein
MATSSAFSYSKDPNFRRGREGEGKTEGKEKGGEG